MHKYERLEKIYYKKKILKIFFIFAVVLGIVGIAFLLKNMQKNRADIKQKTATEKKKLQKNDLNKTKSKKREEIKEVKKEKEEVKKKEVKKIIKKTEKVKSEKKETKNDLSFTMPLINMEDNSSNENNKTEIKEIKKEEIKKVEKVKPEKKVLIIEEKMNVSDLIKSFNQNPNYTTAIQIADYYIKQNKFDLAKLWALKANNINPSKADSWKIFAIILIKQKKLNKAKEVLNIYLNDYGENPEIKKLLRSINE